MADIKKETAVDTAAAAEEDIAADKSEKHDDALESFLSREQEEKKPLKKGMKKSRKTLLIVIGAVVVVAILVAVLIILNKLPGTSKDENAAPAEMTLDVNADGVHEASVALDENGKIENDGAGSLLSYATADIKKIDVENTDGSFSVISSTSDGEATVYTVVGFEDFDLQKGIADEIASHSATVDFTRVIAVNANLADFGLDNPRATVTVSFNDDTSAVIRVGNEAAGEAGTYLGFGTSDTVYLVATDNVKSYLYSVNDLISQTITETNEDSENTTFTKLTISGTHFDEPITLEPNTDEAIEAEYIVTSPVAMFANAVEASDIAGNIRGLSAESVVCVNPNADQMALYGLSTPYATAQASYPDADITLHTSAPNDDGTVYIYNPDKNIIYTIQLAAVCWAKTSVDLLVPENPLNVRMRYVSSLSFTAGDTDFTLDVKTTTQTVTDDSGTEQEASDTTASYNGKELKTEDFNVFFQNLTAIKNQGKAESTGKDKVMSVTFGYTTDRSADTLDVYTGDATHYILAFNGSTVGTASKAYINDLIEGANNLIKGEPVAGL